MAKSSPNKKPRFPMRVETHGRVGKIYKLGNGTFKSYFLYAGEAKHNTHATAESAYLYLQDQFSKLDTDKVNATALHPLSGNVQHYAELEQLLRDKADGATLREAVQSFIYNQSSIQWKPKNFSECAEAFVTSQGVDNSSSSHIKTLKKHFRRFGITFGDRKIHEITAAEFSEWLGKQKSDDTKKPWSPKTRKSVRGSLVSLARYAKDILKAIRAVGDTEFEKVGVPKPDIKAEVEIYTPEEIKMLLEAAIENKIALIPAIVVGSFAGLRPNEFHGEEKDGPPLTWEAFNWIDGSLSVVNQKVRSMGTRDIPLQKSALAWLKPFKEQKGTIWGMKKVYDDSMRSLRKKAGVQGIYDGFRHSYASYRIRQLKQDLNLLAAEMGNSPNEIIKAYKRNVTDAEAEKWFSIYPPKDYDKLIKAALAIS